MVPVDHAHPHAATMGIGRASALQPILMRDEPRLVEPQPAIELVVVKEQQTRRAPRRDLDIALEHVGRVARSQQQRRRVHWRRPAPLEQQRAILHPRPARFVRRGPKEIPFRAQPQRRKIVGQRHAMGQGLPAARLGQGLGQIAPHHAEPAILGPLDRIEQRLPPQRPEAIFIAMIDRPPAFVGRLHQAGMAARPPALVQAGRAHQRIGRMLLPRAMDRSRSGGDHHMAGRRPRRPAHGRQHVEPVAMAMDFGSFGREAFDIPIIGIAPGIIDMLDRADGRQAVFRQPDAVAARQEQPSAAIFPHRVAGIDMVVQLEVYGVAPWPVDRVGMDDEDAVGLRLHRNVEEIAPRMLFQADRPDRADIPAQRRPARLPVDEIAAVPDGQAGIGIKGRKGHVIIRAVLQDGGIGSIAGNQRIEEAPVTQVGDPLIVEAPFPFRRRRALGQGGGDGRSRAQRDRAPRQGSGQGVAAADRHGCFLAAKWPGPRVQTRPGPGVTA